MKTFEQFEKAAYIKFCRESSSQQEEVLQETWAQSDARKEMLIEWEEYEQGRPCATNSN